MAHFNFLEITPLFFKVEENFNVADVINNNPKVKLLSNIVKEEKYKTPIEKLPRGVLLKLVLAQIGGVQTYQDCMNHIARSCSNPIMPNLEGLTALWHYGKDKMPPSGCLIFGFDKEKHLFSPANKVPVLAQDFDAEDKCIIDCTTRVNYGQNGKLKTYLAYYTTDLS